jgi:predicted AlkP superfamily pyrophosphatase or phosphodiesterase
MKRVRVALAATLLLVFLAGGLGFSADSSSAAESNTNRLIPEDSIDRVILVSIDSMNSDYVFNDRYNRDFSLTPNIGELTKNGVAYQDATGVLAAVTQVNHVAMVSGSYAEKIGFVDNFLIRDWENPLSIDWPYKNPEFILVDTIFEAMERENPEYTSAVVAQTNCVGMPIWADYQVAPSALSDSVKREFPGIHKFPAREMYNDSVDSPVMDYALEILDKKDPDMMLLHLGFLDAVQHDFGHGSKEAWAAVHWADHQVGRLLRYLSESGKLNRTLVVLVADHGQSNILIPVDFQALMNEHGIECRVLPLQSHGNIFLKNREDLDEAVAALWETGVVDGVWGGDALDEVHMRTPYTGDIFFSVRPPYYNALPNTGKPFFIFRAPDVGSHGGLSELYVPVVFFGPKVDRGVLHQGGASLVDIAPTIVDLTGLPLPNDSQGKVLGVRNDDYGESPLITYHQEEATAQRVGKYPIFMFLISLTLLIAFAALLNFRLTPVRGIANSALSFIGMPLRTQFGLALLSLLTVLLVLIAVSWLDLQTIYSDVPGIHPDSLIAPNYTFIPAGAVTMSWHPVFVIFMAIIVLGGIVGALVSKYLLKVRFASALAVFLISVIPIALAETVYFLTAVFMTIPSSSIFMVTHLFVFVGLGFSLIYGAAALRRMSDRSWWRISIPVAVFGFLVGFISIYVMLMGVLYPEYLYSL